MTNISAFFWLLATTMNDVFRRILCLNFTRVQIVFPNSFFFILGAIWYKIAPKMKLSATNVVFNSNVPNSPQRLLPLISTVTTATTSKSILGYPGVIPLARWCSERNHPWVSEDEVNPAPENRIYFFTFIFKTEYIILVFFH